MVDGVKLNKIKEIQNYNDSSTKSLPFAGFLPYQVKKGCLGDVFTGKPGIPSLPKGTF
jgi:hypothetical protein